MADAPAYAPVIHAASGYEQAYLQYQKAGDRPANNGIFIADVLGAVQATSAIHLALFERERSGKGQSIDVALLDSVLGMLVWEIQAAQFPSNRRRQVYEPVRASDGYVMVAAVTPKNLAVLFEVIDYPQGMKDPRFSTVAAKEENWSVLLELIEQWTSQRPALECEEKLMAAGVPCSRYRSVAQALDDPQMRQRGMLTRLGNEDESFLVANPPFKFSRSEVTARTGLPGLGEHTREVLNEVLAVDEERLDRLAETGVFGAGTNKTEKAAAGQST
jgi:crotonobetainyl-CoA:carnitine CoA-transferase CaiB-like acyl-CoA transferase